MDAIECRPGRTMRQTAAVVAGTFVVLATVGVTLGGGPGSWGNAAIAVMWCSQVWLLRRALLRVDDDGVLRRAVRTRRLRWEEIAAVDVRSDSMTSLSLRVPVSAVGHDGQRVPLAGSDMSDCAASLRKAVLAEAARRGIDVPDGEGMGL